MKTPPSLRLLIALALTSGLLPAQQPPTTASESSAPAGLDQPEEDQPHSVTVRFEVFSLEKSAAAALLRKDLVDEALYKELIDHLGNDQVVQEGLVQLRARSGEKATTEGISEHIYPVSWVHGNGPTPQQPPGPSAAPAGGTGTTASRSGTNGGGYFAPALPVNFETRNVGWSLEIEPTIGMNYKIIDLRFVPGLVKLAGHSKFGQGVSETTMPIFENQSLHTALTCYADKPGFCGTFNPPPLSKLVPNAANRVWFAFVTCTVKIP